MIKNIKNRGLLVFKVNDSFTFYNIANILRDISDFCEFLSADNITHISIHEIPLLDEQLKNIMFIKINTDSS